MGVGKSRMRDGGFAIDGGGTATRSRRTPVDESSGDSLTDPRELLASLGYVSGRGTLLWGRGQPARSDVRMEEGYHHSSVGVGDLKKYRCRPRKHPSADPPSFVYINIFFIE